MYIWYMTEEGQEGKVKNRRKYAILKDFVRRHVNDKNNSG